MSVETRLNELLFRYEELRERGDAISPEELCRDCPELLAELRRQIDSLASIDQLLVTAGTEEPELGLDSGRLEIPGFEIQAEIGRGGMGVVYQARQRALDRLVAVKVILAGSHAGPHERSRLRTEALAVARIQHPNIVQIYDIGAHEGKPYIVLELVDGVGLDRELAGRPWPARRAAELVECLARAVQAVHERGVVHRDLKPANVLLARDGTPKIADFGLAKHLGQPGSSSAGAQTQSGALLGTPRYMAPEQAAGQTRAIGPWTDVYALGAILYEALTGRPPFEGSTLLETLEQVRSREPVRPSRLQPGLPRDLETICLRALAKEPARRYTSAQALVQDLRRFLDGQPIAAPRESLLARAWRWQLRLARLRDAGTFLIAHGLVRLLMAGLVLRKLILAFDAGALGMGTFIGDLVWIFGTCIILLWAGWRSRQGHVLAVWIGLATALMYLATRALYVPQLLEAGEEAFQHVLLYWFLFVVQAGVCTMALLSYYFQHEPSSERQ